MRPCPNEAVQLTRATAGLLKINKKHNVSCLGVILKVAPSTDLDRSPLRSGGNAAVEQLPRYTLSIRNQRQIKKPVLTLCRMLRAGAYHFFMNRTQSVQIQTFTVADRVILLNPVRNVEVGPQIFMCYQVYVNSPIASCPNFSCLWST